jgi:hypothetical protein
MGFVRRASESFAPAAPPIQCQALNQHVVLLRGSQLYVLFLDIPASRLYTLICLLKFPPEVHGVVQI